MLKRVATPTAVVSLLWLAMGCATIYYVNHVHKFQSHELSESVTAIQLADSMVGVLWRLHATAIDVTETADGHTRLEVAELEQSFENHLAALAEDSASPDAQALAATIDDQFARYQQYVARRLDPMAEPGVESPRPREMAQLAHAIADSCQQYVKAKERTIADAASDRGRFHVAFDLIMVVLWIAGPVVGILWGLWVARGLRRSISQISITLNDAASGMEQEIGCVSVHPTDDLPVLQQQVQTVSLRIKEIMQQLQQARQEAMRADRLAAIGEMASGVAHELRNPLTSVKLLIQTAADGPPGQSLSEEHIRVVLEQIVRMETTIQGLLDFGRPPQMQMIGHDVRNTLRRALNLVEGHAVRQGVAIREDWPDEPVEVNGDPEQLNQVFINLLLNGVESMPAGGDLEVVVQCRDSETPVVEVIFADSGTGIPQSVLERLFEPFVTTKQRGTGLGLAISQRIVERHGGKLTALNRESCGAVFRVELPVIGEARPGKNIEETTPFELGQG